MLEVTSYAGKGGPDQLRREKRFRKMERMRGRGRAEGQKVGGGGSSEYPFSQPGDSNLLFIVGGQQKKVDWKV